jgi:serine/threonine protein kinase
MISELPVSIHGYTFLRLIGQGGYASAYIVQSDVFQTEFCAKVSDMAEHHTEEDAGSIEREIRALTSLNHPHILRLYEHFMEQDLSFMILELCRGGSLSSEMPGGSPIPLPRFKVLGREILSALAHCHENHFAHCDIKLGNILLDEYGRTKLADFGIAIHVDSSMAFVERTAGTIRYESPELLNKKAHNPFKADVWALGVAFAEMIAGHSPWHTDTIGKLKKAVMTGAYRLPRKTPTEVADLISKMIVVDPEARLSMAEILTLPIFEPVARFDSRLPIGDCLSRLGRRRIARLGFTLQKEDTSLDPEKTREEYYADPPDPSAHYPRNSKALAIQAWNYESGFKTLMKIKPRYNPPVKRGQVTSG